MACCWSVRCFLQVHIRYLVIVCKLVSGILSKFVIYLAPLKPHGKVVGTVWCKCKGLVADDLWNHQTFVIWRFTTLLKGERREPSKRHCLLYDKIADFGGTSFSAAKNLKNVVPHVNLKGASTSKRAWRELRGFLFIRLPNLSSRGTSNTLLTQMGGGHRPGLG